MKRIPSLLTLAAAFAILLAACAPVTPTPILTEPPVVPTDTPAPTLVPVTLAWPEAGASMLGPDGGVMVFVPAGEFTMGAGGFDDPQHTVNLSGYWIGKTKVTNRMYGLCVALGVCTPPSQEPGAAVYTDPAFADHPVVGVTWEQASAYCAWSGARLPTEAEWEKAARGTSAQLYPWGGAEPSCDLLNFDNCKGATTSVMTYPQGASPYGALDMAGNVFEWVGDWYAPDYYAVSPAQDPSGPAEGQARVVRGSSFESEPAQAALTIRHYANPALARRDTGFRCAASQPRLSAPYCVANAYQPVAPAPAVSGCEVPAAQVRGNYCAGAQGFATVDIPPDATYEMTTRGFECSEAVIDGQRRLTCSGPDNSTGQLTLCNPACADPTPNPDQGAVCDPGYARDAATGLCAYQPLPLPSGPQACPPGYALDSTGQTCRPGTGLDGLCPVGQYFDAAFNGCVPANGQFECNLYGLDNRSLAGACFENSCPAGYSYHPDSQCCQSEALLYPGCRPGYLYDAAYGGCVPGVAQASGAGCTTISLDILQCGEPFNCGKFTTEVACINNAVYGCQWNDQINVCENK